MASVEAKHSGYIMPFEYLPPRVIDDIEVNQQMADGVTDPHLRQWFNKEFLLKNACLFATGINNSDRYQADTLRPQPPIMHRGVALRIIKSSEPYVDEYGVRYGQITSKGNGITPNGVKYWNPSGSIGVNPPLGFFGYHHSQQEMEVSNRFAAAGGRNGRVIATIALNHSELRTWFAEKTKNSPYPMSKELEKVEKNGDQIALCIRLMGADRYTDLSRAKRKFFFTKRDMISRAAHVVLSEVRSQEIEEFQRRYQIKQNGDFWQQLISALTRLQSGIMSQDDCAVLAAVNHSFYEWNTQVFKTVRASYDNKLFADIRQENTDIAGFWYDWEACLPGKQYISSSYFYDASDLLNRISQHFNSGEDSA